MTLGLYLLHDQWNSDYIGYLIKKEDYGQAYQYVMDRKCGQLD